MTEASTTSNGHEIQLPRERLGLDEFKHMLIEHGLNGETAMDRLGSLKKMSSEQVAIMITDINARAQGSGETLVNPDVMHVGHTNDEGVKEKTELAKPEDRYDVFNHTVESVKRVPEDINPARVGDTLALATVLTHPFVDGNGRTARLIGFAFRDDMNGEDAQEDFNTLIAPRDEARAKSGFVINGYIPYLPGGADQSDPVVIKTYIDKVLTSQADYLYTSPYGQAELTNTTQLAQHATA